MLTRFCVSDINVRDFIAIVNNYFLGVYPILWTCTFFGGYVRCPQKTHMRHGENRLVDNVPIKIKKTIAIIPYFIWWNVVSLVRTFSDGL